MTTSPHDTVVATTLSLAEHAHREGAARLVLVLGQNAPAAQDPDGPAFPPGTPSRRRALALWNVPAVEFERTIRVNVLPLEPELLDAPLAVGGARLEAVLDALGGSDVDILAAGAWAADIAAARLGLRRRPVWNNMVPTRRGRLLCVGHPSGRCRRYNDAKARAATADAVRTFLATGLRL